jgi:2-polyprenyl-3-methyl-5-hydroxy-6-metoxy-1,4-benzoquinol methylase
VADIVSNRRQHWDQVYAVKGPTEVSWYQPHLERSLALIESVAVNRSTAIIDIGGGASTLVDDLILRGYTDITVLDISQTAVDGTRRRLGLSAKQVEWFVGDVCEVELVASRYELWHDRAVFHFLTLPGQRAAYVTRAAASVQRNGHLVVSTFGPEGPMRCSGLDTAHYDAAALEAEFGSQFRLANSQMEWHTTPAGGKQQFLYCLFQRL